MIGKERPVTTLHSGNLIDSSVNHLEPTPTNKSHLFLQLPRNGPRAILSPVGELYSELVTHPWSPIAGGGPQLSGNLNFSVLSGMYGEVIYFLRSKATTHSKISSKC